jgi:hypothetical protein
LRGWPNLMSLNELSTGWNGFRAARAVKETEGHASRISNTTWLFDHRVR